VVKELDQMRHVEPIGELHQLHNEWEWVAVEWKPTTTMTMKVMEAKHLVDQ